jgi:hypothetical protein
MCCAELGIHRQWWQGFAADWWSLMVTDGSIVGNSVKEAGGFLFVEWQSQCCTGGPELLLCTNEMIRRFRDFLI